MKEKKLKFGILCNSLTLQQWQANAIKGLISHPSFELSLLIINGNSVQKKSLYKKLFSRTLLFTQYETRFLKIPAKQSIDMQDLLEETPQITVTTINKGKFSQYFKDEDVAKIRAKELDFIIRFGFGVLKGEILNASKYGVWSYHHGDEQQYRGGPPGFWEIYYGSKITSVILQQLTPELDGGKVLKKGAFKTVYNSYSVQLEEILTHSSECIKQTGLQILEGQLTIEKIPSAGAKGKLNKAPGNFVFILFLLKLFWNKLDYKNKSLFRVELWNIGKLNNPLSDVFDKKELSVSWLSTKGVKKYSYRADPFILKKNGYKVFFEKYNYFTGKGYIACADFNPETEELTNEAVTLAPGHHLSYPSVFTHEGVNYCLPEAFNNNKLDLFEIKDDYSLTKVSTLLSGIPVVDPTLFYHHQKFWLFCTINKKAPNAQLFIFYSNTLTGPYLPHLLNPVKTDICSSRPAGSIFKYEGKIIRPSQNCSETYGGSLVLNEIVTLTETAYEEKLVTEIKPFFSFTDAYTEGIHHISIDGNTVLVDGKKYIYSHAIALGRRLGLIKG